VSAARSPELERSFAGGVERGSTTGLARLAAPRIPGEESGFGESRMDIEGRRRSDNFEDRGQGGGRAAAGLPVAALAAIVQRLGLRGSLIVAAIAGVAYFVLPASVRQMLLGAVTGNSGASSPAATGGSACQASPGNAKACDFSRAVLASTEDVWAAEFQQGRLPSYGRKPGPYQQPTLVVFAGGVSTGGCGGATSDAGPFYCPGDRKLYIDPSFYDVMEKHLKAPGDFAQAYVIAHEVGHHVQNLIGASEVGVRGESKNQSSVRLELQADCLAGVWGHTAKASLKITDEDLREAVNAAHAIGDDALGHQNADDYTHGTSAQRMRWFRTGFDGGDARRCDTFAVDKYSAL
jgi:predicted metalloprotease